MRTRRFCVGEWLSRIAALLCCLWSLSLVRAESPGSSRAIAKIISVEHSRLNKQRVNYVRSVLNERCNYVMSGKRARDFNKWVNKVGGATILSTHGLDIDDAVLDVISSEKQPAVLEFGSSEKTLFPEDKRDLDLVPILGVPSMYVGNPIHLIDDRPASLLRLFFRAMRLGIKFAPVSTTLWLAFLSPKFRENVWYGWISRCLASCGPAYIKWGQWAATRSDMFPEALCEKLSHLHADAPAHSWSFTQKMIESSLGLPRGSILEVFGAFETKPVASGSIAQVHKAVLKGDKEDHLVAVKVRHPQVSQLIDMDFRIMSTMASIIEWIPAMSWLHIRESVEQFSHTMAAQAHLNVEAHHLEVLNDNFRKWNHVKFPRPFYASNSVIIETYEDGNIVSDILDTYDALADDVSNEPGKVSVEEVDDNGTAKDVEGRGHELIPVDLARFIVTTGLSLYLKMLLIDNLMHADLHPGNIMLDVHQEAAAGNSTKLQVPMGIDHSFQGLSVCLVDAGMVAQLTDEESANFIGLLCSLGDGDGKFAAECALRFSKETNLTPEERQAFVDDIVQVFQERCRGYHTNVDVGDVLRGVLGMIRKHHVRVDANYATLVVNALCVESMARRVCPNYNLLDAAKPMLQSYRKIAYEKDGASKKFAHQAVRKAMPFMNFQKNRQDKAFFKRRLRTLKRNLRRK